MFPEALVALLIAQRVRCEVFLSVSTLVLEDGSIGTLAGGLEGKCLIADPEALGDELLTRLMMAWDDARHSGAVGHWMRNANADEVADAKPPLLAGRVMLDA